MQIQVAGNGRPPNAASMTLDLWERSIDRESDVDPAPAQVRRVFAINGSLLRETSRDARAMAS
jgi:hypothetical protein